MSKLQAVLPDLMMIAGGSSLAYGAWMAWPPAGFLVAGGLAIAAGITMARAG